MDAKSFASVHDRVSKVVTARMKDPQQPPVRRGLPLGWHLILSTALIIAVVMGGISVSQQLADMRQERATHQNLLRDSLVPLAARMEGVGSLQQMRDLVKEFHEAHLDFGDAEHNVVLIDSAGVLILSTLPPSAPLGNGVLVFDGPECWSHGIERGAVPDTRKGCRPGLDEFLGVQKAGGTVTGADGCAGRDDSGTLRLASARPKRARRIVDPAQETASAAVSGQYRRIARNVNEVDQPISRSPFNASMPLIIRRCPSGKTSPSPSEVYMTTE